MINNYDISNKRYTFVPNQLKQNKAMGTKKIEYLTEGDTVNWRGAWGSEPPKKVKVEAIEICKEGDKEGNPVESVAWSKVNSRKIVVTLDNGHWAYGTQLDKI